MGEINFIPNQNPNNNGSNNHDKGEGDISWTKPENSSGEIRSKEDEKQKFKDEDYAEKTEDKIKKTEPAPTKHATGNKIEKIDKVGFLSRLKNILAGPKPEKEQVSGFRKNKDVLVDYQEVFKKEKLKRNPNSLRGSLDKRSDKIYSTPEKIEPVTKKRKIVIKSFKDILKIMSSFGDESLSVSNILKTNLIKGEVTAFFDWKKHLRVVFLYLFFTGAFVSLIYVGLDYWEGSISERGAVLIGEIEEIIPKIKKAEKEVEIVDDFQRKLSLATLLLDKHIYWTNFFKFLEEHTINDVYYESDFSGGINGQYNLKSVAGSYGMVADQIKVFEESDFIINASVNSARLTKSTASSEGEEDTEATVGVGYDMDLKIKPDIFYR